MELYVVAACLLVLVAIFWFARNEGRRAEQRDNAVASNEIKDDQLQTAADAPKNPGELVDRIRKEGW